MAELTQDDRKILMQAATIAARRKIAPYLGLLMPHVAALRAHLPSYVNDAIDQVVAALARWERDEETAIISQGKL